MLLARNVITFDTSGKIPSTWLCSAFDGYSCDIKALRANALSWAINDNKLAGTNYGVHYPIEYCLSQPVPERCTVQLSLMIMAVEIFCNTVKVSRMVLLLWQQKSAPLITIGEAVESFMLDRHMTIQNMYWANKEKFISQKREPSTMPWLRRSRLWFASASIKRWLICNTCSVTALIIGSILLHLGIAELGNSGSGHLWKSGFGNFNSNLSGSCNHPGTSGILL